MVKVTCQKSGGVYKSFSFLGHAGFDKKGRDIVCAAASVLFINTVNSIEKFADDKIKTEFKGDKVVMSFQDSPSERAKLLLDSMMLGLTETEKEYGKEYLSIEIQEV